jgi:hypothetical protein
MVVVIAIPNNLAARRLFEDCLHHFIAQLDGIGETRSEVPLDPLKSIAIGLEVAKRDTVRPCLFCADDVSSL